MMSSGGATALHRAVRDPVLLAKLVSDEPEGFLLHEEYQCVGQQAGVFHCAVLSNTEESVRLLLEHGADIDEVDDHGRTSLIKAATECLDDMVKLLVDLGADVNIQDNDGQNCAHAAYSMEHVELGDFLVQQTNVDVSAIDSSDKTPLDWKQLYIEDEVEEKYETYHELKRIESNAFVINGEENNFAAGTGIRATRWLKKSDNGVICCDK